MSNSTTDILQDEQDTHKTTMNHGWPLTLDALALSVNAVEVSAPVEVVLEARSKLAFMAEQVQAMKKRLDAQLIDWIEANGAITCGTKRLYVWNKKETKCNDLAKAIECLMNDCNGDFDMLCRCLSVNAIKYGAAKTVMKPEHYEQHFTQIVKTELREGVETPVKQLQESDERFTR